MSTAKLPPLDPLRCSTHIEPFQDHSGQRAVRAYWKYWQEDTQPPEFAFQVYTYVNEQTSSESQQDAFALQVLEKLTDADTRKVWRFDLYNVTTDKTRQDLAAHYRRERAFRTHLRFPDLSQSMSPFTSIMVIVDSVSRWSRGLASYYVFDHSPTHRNFHPDEITMLMDLPLKETREIREGEFAEVEDFSLFGTLNGVWTLYDLGRQDDLEDMRSAQGTYT